MSSTTIQAWAAWFGDECQASPIGLALSPEVQFAARCLAPMGNERSLMPNFSIGIMSLDGYKAYYPGVRRMNTIREPKWLVPKVPILQSLETGTHQHAY